MKQKNPTLLWKVIAAVLAVALIAVSCTWAITANNRQTATKPAETTAAASEAASAAEHTKADTLQTVR